MGRGFDPHTLKEVLTDPSVYVIREGMVVFGFIEELEVIKLLILRGKIHVELHQTVREFLIILGVGESELIVEFFLVHDLSISYLRELCTDFEIFFFEVHFFVTQTMPVVVWSQRTEPLGAKLVHHTCSPIALARMSPTPMMNILPSGWSHISLSVSMVPVYHFIDELYTDPKNILLESRFQLPEEKVS